MEEEMIVGKKLEDYVDRGDRNIVRRAVSGHDSESRNLVRLALVSAKGTRTVVGAELSPLIINGRYKGGCAHMTDISITEKQNHNLYDRALLGIVKLNRKGDVLFANKSMLQMLNMKDYHGVGVFDLLPDEESKKYVREQLISRFSWKCDEYPVDLLRAGDDARVPVLISAFPETDLDGERVIGSFAIVCNMVSKRMHYLIESHHCEKDLLQAVMKELALIIPFDLVAVAKYSDDRKFS